VGNDKLIFGLTGSPLGHSFSPTWFRDKFIREGIENAEYNLFPLASAGEFPALLVNVPELAGLNVTTPHKESILPYLDELDEISHAIGAVNTITIKRKGGMIRTMGYNTDAHGFYRSIMNMDLNTPALILGTGGGARAVAYALKQKDVGSAFVSRTRRSSNTVLYQDLDADIISQHLLIINATPVGMYPETDLFPPIPYHLLTNRHILYDLIYNPEETEFLKKGKSMNTLAINGMQMLHHQAEWAYKIFLGLDLPDDI
jgi:shikimate dehydrogenase